jgi:hypothetical protein
MKRMKMKAAQCTLLDMEDMKRRMTRNDWDCWTMKKNHQIDLADDKVAKRYKQ